MVESEQYNQWVIVDLQIAGVLLSCKTTSYLSLSKSEAEHGQPSVALGLRPQGKCYPRTINGLKNSNDT